MELDGKVAVITGGSTGIGRATASAFADRGMRLVLASRRAERLQATVDDLTSGGAEVIGVATDIGNADDVQRLAHQAFDTFGRVDVAFLNAGAPSADRLTAPDLDVWRTAVDTNILGLVQCLRAFVPRMVDQGGGASGARDDVGCGHPRHRLRHGAVCGDEGRPALDHGEPLRPGA